MGRALPGPGTASGGWGQPCCVPSPLLEFISVKGLARLLLLPRLPSPVGDLRINSLMGRAACGCPALSFSLTSGLEVGSPLCFCETPKLREKPRLPFHPPTKLPSLSVPSPTWPCLAVHFEMKYLSFGPQPLISCRKQRASPGLLQGTSIFFFFWWGEPVLAKAGGRGGAEGRYFWPREEAPAPVGPPLRGRACGPSPEVPQRGKPL